MFILEYSFILLKNFLKQTWKSFNTKLWPQWKDPKSSYKIRQILALFCDWIALMLSKNCLKALRVTKTVQKAKFERVQAELEGKICFQKQSFAKCFRLTQVSMWNSTLRAKFDFSFSIALYYYSQIFILARRLVNSFMSYEV